MRNHWLFIPVFLVAKIVFAQSPDTTAINLNEVVVTATRNNNLLMDIPAQVDVINKDEINSFPLSTIDDILKSAANVYVNRSWGIFSKNAAITMRGLEGSDRVLILIDGIPKNSLTGGSVNWHNVQPAELEKIEVVKGPVSALYGNNAMGGVINLITRLPEKKFEGSAEAFYGTYNTLGGNLNLGGNHVKNEEGFYWLLNGFYRQGDGYLFEAPDYIDPTDIKTALNEGGLNLKTGYRFNNKQRIELVVDQYNEVRGGGTKIFTNEGSVDHVFTGHFRANHYATYGKALVTTSVYYTNEDYFSQKESMNESAEYRLLDSYLKRQDYGLISTMSLPWFARQRLTAGFEIKSGSSTYNENYRTSPDELYSNGKLDIAGIFVQNELPFWKSKLKAVLGLRLDAARFYDGRQSVVNPTKATGFSKSFDENFDPNSWFALSPKASLEYAFKPLSRMYVSVSRGFKPPKIKDLSQSGKINKGFRLANPELEPEYLTNYEIGYRYLQNERLIIGTALYYSLGRDFQYSVSTGDSVDTGGTSLKPVLVSENIARVKIAGLELSASYFITRQLSVQLSYAYNYSIISEYHPSLADPSANLSGKQMAEVSPHTAYAGLDWKNRYFNFQINGNYVDQQWFDPENTILVDDYFLLNTRISRVFYKHYQLAFDAQNLLDNQFVDRKGELAPGRYMTFTFTYKF